MFTASAKRVMSLQDPRLKMSKSHADPRSRILLTDSPDEINRKVMAALTDSTNSVSYEPDTRPGVSNLLQLLSYLDREGRSAESLGAEYSHLNLRLFKTMVSETIAASLSTIQKRYSEVMREHDGRYLDYVEMIGAQKARKSAEATMAIIREVVGL